MSKKKKHYVTITLLFTGLIIVLGIWGYNKIIRPTYLNNANQTKTINLKSNTELAFGKYDNQGDVFGIEIEVSGNSASNFDLIISNGEQDMHAATIKGEDIEYIYKNDWYVDSCFLTVIPKGKVGGKVTVDCRFLALD